MAIIINGTTGLSGVDGSAGTPALQGSDSNTGISFGTDTVNINTGGSTRATVDSSGRVGIGTATPSSLLHVEGTAGNAKIRLGSGGDHTVIGPDSSGHTVINAATSGGNMQFQLAGIESARITSTGDFQFNSGFGSVATAYGVRAWVNFNASGTLTVRGSGNISSVTDNGVGQFATNFTNAMPDTNYAGVCSHNSISLGNDGAQASPDTTSAAFVQTGSNSAWRDPTVVCVAFFR